MNPLSHAASRQIFTDVFNQYLAFLEERDHLAIESRDFCLDVESHLKTLYPDPLSFRDAHALLVDTHSQLPATRIALGQAFLNSGLWPVKNYFTKRS